MATCQKNTAVIIIAQPPDLKIWAGVYKRFLSSEKMLTDSRDTWWKSMCEWVGLAMWKGSHSVKLPEILPRSRNHFRCPMSPRCCPLGRRSGRMMLSLCPAWKGLYWERREKQDCIDVFHISFKDVCSRAEVIYRYWLLNYLMWGEM